MKSDATSSGEVLASAAAIPFFSSFFWKLIP